MILCNQQVIRDKSTSYNNLLLYVEVSRGGGNWSMGVSVLPVTNVLNIKAEEILKYAYI